MYKNNLLKNKNKVNHKNVTLVDYSFNGLKTCAGTITTSLSVFFGRMIFEADKHENDWFCLTREYLSRYIYRCEKQVSRYIKFFEQAKLIRVKRVTHSDGDICITRNYFQIDINNCLKVLSAEFLETTTKSVRDFFRRIKGKIYDVACGTFVNFNSKHNIYNNIGNFFKNLGSSIPSNDCEVDMEKEYLTKGLNDPEGKNSFEYTDQLIDEIDKKIEVLNKHSDESDDVGEIIDLDYKIQELIAEKKQLLNAYTSSCTRKNSNSDSLLSIEMKNVSGDANKIIKKVKDKFTSLSVNEKSDDNRTYFDRNMITCPDEYRRIALDMGIKEHYIEDEFYDFREYWTGLGRVKAAKKLDWVRTWRNRIDAVINNWRFAYKRQGVQVGVPIAQQNLVQSNMYSNKNNQSVYQSKYKSNYNQKKNYNNYSVIDQEKPLEVDFSGVPHAALSIAKTLKKNVGEKNYISWFQYNVQYVDQQNGQFGIHFLNDFAKNYVLNDPILSNIIESMNLSID